MEPPTIPINTPHVPNPTRVRKLRGESFKSSSITSPNYAQLHHKYSSNYTIHKPKKDETAEITARLFGRGRRWCWWTFWRCWTGRE